MVKSSHRQPFTRWLIRSYAGRIIISLALIAVIQLMAFYLNFVFPVQRELLIARKVEALGGRVEWQRRGPRWIYGIPYANNLPRITGITLGGDEVAANVFQPVPAEFVSEIAALNWLEFLFLTGPLVTDKQIVQLKGLKRTLDDIPQTLDLQGTQLTDAGLEHLKGLTNLGTLNLSSTQIGDSGLNHLKRLSSLMDLDLANTKITDEGLKYLEGMASVTNINLNGTQTTPEGREMLRKALPICLVTPEP